jgi:hypothetical protein
MGAMLAVLIKHVKTFDRGLPALLLVIAEVATYL